MSHSLWTRSRQGTFGMNTRHDVSANREPRMQSIDAKKEYKNSFQCAAKIFKEEGVSTFWSGAVPRLARLILSGGIVFTM